MTLAPVVQVSSSTEAREALECETVQGVICEMPPASEVQEALRDFSVPFRSAVGPVRYSPKQPDRLSPVFLEHLTRLQVAEDRPHLRAPIVAEILFTLRFFSEVLGGGRPLECKIRFQRPGSVASRPHYDPSALTLLRTFLGPGTWLLPRGMERIQVRPPQASIHKGSEYPGGGTARLLHDYPSSADPTMTERGRIILIALSRHGV